MAVSLTGIGVACALVFNTAGLSIFDYVLEHVLQLGGRERQAADLVEGDGVDQVGGADDLRQLAQVIRGRYLVDALPYNQVRGLPFTATELESMLEDVVKNA